MKELRTIVDRLALAQREGEPAALATVIAVAGSTYRRPGAKMLITAQGSVAGGVSGGCLEHDVIERAQHVIKTGKACVVPYDSSADDDIVWGLGLGCRGVVHVLIERLETGTVNPVSFLAHCMQRRHTGVIATLIAVQGNSRAQLGERLMIHQGEDEPITNIADGALQRVILERARAAMQSGSQLQAIDLLDARCEVFFEVFEPPLPLVVFGAGHDAEPLVRFARELGWHITVVDHRRANLAMAQHWQADNVIFVHPRELQGKVRLDERTAAVLMYHNYLDDLAALKHALQSPAPYVGVLGPKQRTQRLLDELERDGNDMTSSQRARLFGPVGLDIGADNPQEIALAIVAEILAHGTNHHGGSLRHRTGPLHVRSDASRPIVTPSTASCQVRCGTHADDAV